MEIQKLVIKTNDNQYLLLQEQQENSSLRVSKSPIPLNEGCWFNSIDEIRNLLDAMTYTTSKYKNKYVMGYTFNGIKPVHIQSINISYNIKNII